MENRKTENKRLSSQEKGTAKSLGPYRSVVFGAVYLFVIMFVFALLRLGINSLKVFEEGNESKDDKVDDMEKLVKFKEEKRLQRLDETERRIRNFQERQKKMAIGEKDSKGIASTLRENLKKTREGQENNFRENRRENRKKAKEEKDLKVIDQ